MTRILRGKYFLIGFMFCWIPMASSNAEPIHDLAVDFELGFKGEDVQVLLNGEEIFSQKGIVTNESMGYAAGGSVAVEAGTYKITVIINGKRKWRKKVTVKGDTYVRLSTFRILGIRFFWSEVSDQPFFYD